MSDLDAVALGSIVWSRTRGVIAGDRFGGMVVDVGLHDDGSPYAIILRELPVGEVKVQVYYRGGDKPKLPRVARLDRIDVADIDPDSVERPDGTRMEGWAKKAILGEVVLPGRTFELVVAAGSLYEAAKQVHVASRTGRQSERDAINEELERRRSEREGLAS